MLNKEKINYPAFLDVVDALPEIDKIKMYLVYTTTQEFMKNKFEIVNSLDENFKSGWGVPDVWIGKTALFYPWKHLKIKTFEEFISRDNVLVRDIGADWKKQDFAQRYHVTYNLDSVYHWYHVLKTPNKKFPKKLWTVIGPEKTRKLEREYRTCGGNSCKVQ